MSEDASPSAAMGLSTLTSPDTIAANIPIEVDESNANLLEQLLIIEKSNESYFSQTIQERLGELRELLVSINNDEQIVMRADPKYREGKKVKPRANLLRGSIYTGVSKNGRKWQVST